MSDCRKLCPAADGGWWDLVEGIVLQAVKDYRLALRDPYRKAAMIADCEDFFRSQWFAVLTDGMDGEALIRRIRCMQPKLSKRGMLVQPHFQNLGRAPHSNSKKSNK